MAPHTHPGKSQAQVLRTFTALTALKPAWGGSIILSLGLGPAGSALSIASNIAGAVALVVDNDPTHLREATRSGAVDFTVTTLDEAIRAMKNEVRKQTPLSVALNADPVRTLDEILERGLAPQLFSTFLSPHPRVAEAATALTSLGAHLVDFTEASTPAPGFQSSQSILSPLITDRGWTLRLFAFDTSAALRDFDSKALSLLPAEDRLRRHWLEAAPRILPRQNPPVRALWLTQPEFNLLAAPQTSSF